MCVGCGGGVPLVAPVLVLPLQCLAPPVPGSRADAHCLPASLTADTFVSPLLALGARNKVRPWAGASVQPVKALAPSTLALLHAESQPCMSPLPLPPCSPQIEEGSAPAYLPTADTAQVLARRFDEMYERVKVRARGSVAAGSQRARVFLLCCG